MSHQLNIPAARFDEIHPNRIRNRLKNSFVINAVRRPDPPALAPSRGSQNVSVKKSNPQYIAHQTGMSDQREIVVGANKHDDRMKFNATPAQVKDTLDQILMQQARRPPAGPTSFNPRLTPAWAGLKIF
jgi:hypothetical protein